MTAAVVEDLNGWPVPLNTLNLQVGAAINDASVNRDNTGFSSVGVQLGINSSTVGTSAQTASGFRFTSVTIPRHATIVTASFSAYAVATKADDFYCWVYCEDVDTSLDFVSQPSLSRPTTAVGCVYDALDVTAAGGLGFVAFGDISVAVQQVVNRPGWVSGNALTVIPTGQGSVTRLGAVSAYDGNPTQGAKLTVSWRPSNSQFLAFF